MADLFVRCRGAKKPPCGYCGKGTDRSCVFDLLVFEDLGTWDASTPAEEVFRKAAQTAIDRVRDLVDSGACQVVGEPVVECVVGRSSR